MRHPEPVDSIGRSLTAHAWLAESLRLGEFATSSPEGAALAVQQGVTEDDIRTEHIYRVRLLAEKLTRLLPHFAQHVSDESLMDVAERFMTSSAFATQHVAEAGFQSFLDRFGRFARAEFSDPALADWAVIDSLTYRLPVSEPLSAGYVLCSALMACAGDPFGLGTPGYWVALSLNEAGRLTAHPLNAAVVQAVEALRSSTEIMDAATCSQLLELGVIRHGAH